MSGAFSRWCGGSVASPAQTAGSYIHSKIIGSSREQGREEPTSLSVESVKSEKGA